MLAVFPKKLKKQNFHLQGTDWFTIQQYHARNFFLACKLNVLQQSCNDVFQHASLLYCTFVIFACKVHVSERAKSAYMKASLVAIIFP